MTFRKSTQYLVRPVCAIISMIALGLIVWDDKAFNGLGNVVIMMCIVWAVTYELITWRSMRNRENESLRK